MTGIGTVLKDDPMLTARGVRVRRTARRVVVDPKLQIPFECKLVRTAKDVPTTIACDVALLDRSNARVEQLRSQNVDFIGIAMNGDELPLQPLLAELSKRHEAQHVLVEAGTGLMSRLFGQKLVNDAWVFIAPMMIADRDARASVHDLLLPDLHSVPRMRLQMIQRRHNDIAARYRVM
jgi:diaminohydroxyphosphoribosylaminopyrimidine deaminase / 5-amino-6-(5-phosphoribosylamino)uracil reductase